MAEVMTFQNLFQQCKEGRKIQKILIVLDEVEASNVEGDSLDLGSGLKAVTEEGEAKVDETL